MRDGWVETTLSEVLTISRERIDPSRLEPDYGLIHWSIPQLDETGGPKNETASEIGSHKFVVLKDSVVYSLLNPRIPRFAKIVGGKRVVCSTEFAVLQPVSSLSLDFLYCFISSPNFQEQVRSLAKGTTKSRERIDNKEIEKLHLKLPPLPEQKRIVDLISSVDTYIEALEHQLESAKKSRNAVLHELLTAGGDDWTEITLGELTEHTRPICYGVLKPGPHVDGGVPLVKITDMDRRLLGPQGMQRISSELDNEFRRSRLKGGEVLLSIQGTVGRVAIADSTLSGANISRTIAVIEPDHRLLNLYLVFVLEKIATEGGFDSAGSTRESLNISTIRNMKISCPPVIEQRRIVEIIDTLDGVVTKSEFTITEARNLRSGLLSDLLNGEHGIPTSYDKVMGAA